MKYSFVLFTVAVVLAAFFHGSQSAIIGVDLGSKYFKVALVAGHAIRNCNECSHEEENRNPCGF